MFTKIYLLREKNLNDKSMLLSYIIFARAYYVRLYLFCDGLVQYSAPQLLLHFMIIHSCYLGAQWSSRNIKLSLCHSMDVPPFFRKKNVQVNCQLYDDGQARLLINKLIIYVVLVHYAYV